MAMYIPIIQMELLLSSTTAPMSMTTTMRMLMATIMATNMEDAATITPMLVASPPRPRLAAAARNTVVVRPSHPDRNNFIPSLTFGFNAEKCIYAIAALECKRACDDDPGHEGNLTL